jgi:hypothetical protein
LSELLLSVVAIHAFSTRDKYFPEVDRISTELQKNGERKMLPGSIHRFLRFIARLPAAVSAASTAAITAVTVPASAPAATAATTTARSSSAPTAATLTRRPRFVDDNIAAHEIVAVQSLDGTFGFLVTIDFDKSEPAWLP